MRLFLLLAALGCLHACGQTGDLVRPSDIVPVSPTAPKP
jgi:predicted small lipoprotein YifL